MSPDASVQAHFFDGRSAKPHRVVLQQAHDTLIVRTATDGQVLTRYPVRHVQWPERTRHGARIAQLPDGASVHALSTPEWDRWRASQGDHGSWVVKAQLSWRATLLSLVGLGLVLAGLYQWGLPWGAQAILNVTPRSVDQRIGESALDSIGPQLFQASRVPPARQRQLQLAFQRLIERTQARGAWPPERSHAPVKLVFKRSRIGPNALAFPDGTIVLTDELIDLLPGQDAVLLGVLAHEWGHVQHRHTMRLLLQTGALSAMASAALGDFSQVAVALPALLGQLGYSRDMEREADETAIAVLKANGIPPRVMVTLFEQLRQAQGPADAEPSHDGTVPGISFSSHPSDAERMARFLEG